jgi:hypothetical protein
MDFLDFTSEFKFAKELGDGVMEDFYDIETLQDIVEDTIYVDRYENKWTVTCSDVSRLDELTNPVENVSFDFSTTTKKQNRNWRCILPEFLKNFKVYQWYKKIDKVDTTFLLTLNKIVITFTYKKDIDERMCFCMNKKM